MTVDKAEKKEIEKKVPWVSFDFGFYFNSIKSET